MVCFVELLQSLDFVFYEFFTVLLIIKKV